MIVDTEDLVTIKTYADIQNVSTTTIYNWSLQGKLELVVIDNVKFIKIR